MKNMESNRRDFIKTASAGGLGASLLGSDSIGLYDNVGQSFAQRPQNAKIRITDIKVAIMGNYPIVRIVTDAGIDGYGQGEPAKAQLKFHILFYKDYLIGEDPTNVERCMMKIRRAGGFKPWGTSVSIIETALWDIAGKAANLPVYKLMGGKVRDHVRTYLTHVRNSQVAIPREGNETKDYYNWAVKFRDHELGFSIVKVPMGFHADHQNVPGFHYGNISRAQAPRSAPYTHAPMTEYGMKMMVEHVAAMKEGLGDKVGLALDIGPGNFLSDAIRLCNALEPYNLMWMEDLLTGDYHPYVMADDYLELTRSTTVPIHTGEQIYLRQHFRELIGKNAVRVVGPDPADVGGMAELKWIAEFADLHSILMAPHGAYNGLIGLAAEVMVGATMPENFIAFEYTSPTDQWWYEIIEGLPNPIVKDSLIEVWDRPGLGVNFNVKAAKQYLREEDKDFFD